MARDPKDLNLVADIGGTNTRVAFADGAKTLSDTTRKYKNAEYNDLESILTSYLADHATDRCHGVCVAAAGPVKDGEGRLTNLDWTITSNGLRQATKATKVDVLNDLQAQGHALGRISDENIANIAGPTLLDPQATKLVVGVGTGFNAAPVYDTGPHRSVPPAEAGHTGLPVQNEADLALSRHLAKIHGFASVEDVLSGRGIGNLHGWLSPDEAGLKANEVMERAAIADPAALRTTKTFARVLGNVVGDLALTYLPFGGIYLVGGVSRAMSGYLTDGHFAEALVGKGRFQGYMQQFSVYVIADDFAALTGCAAHLTEVA